MRRRDLLTVGVTGLGTAFSGCGQLTDSALSGSEGGNGPGRENSGSSKRNESIQTTLKDFVLTNTFQDTEYLAIPPEGDVFLFVRVKSTNKGSEPKALPHAANFALLIDDNQYSHYPDEYMSPVSDIRSPIEGKFYEGLMTAHPDVSRSGWLLFLIPRETKSAQLALSWSQGGVNLDSPDGDTVSYWGLNLNPDNLPDLSTTVSAPDSAEISEEFSFNVSIENTGGSEGRFTSKYGITRPGDRISISTDVTTTDEAGTSYSTLPSGNLNEGEGLIDMQVPAGETKTWNESIRANTVGSAMMALYRTNQKSKVSIGPATRSYGQTFRLQESIQVTAEPPKFSSSYTYESVLENEEKTPTTGMKYAFVKVGVENPTSDVSAAPSRSSFTLERDGQTFEQVEYPSIGTTEFHSPIQGESLDLVGFETSTTISSGESVSGWLLFTVPENMSDDELALRAKWSSSGIVETQGGNIIVRWE